MDTAEALGLTRHLLEGLCQIRLEPRTFTGKDGAAYERLCRLERELLRHHLAGAQAPDEVLRHAERVLSVA